MSAAVAGEVRHGVLEPIMDARTLNLDQADRLARLDTEAVDSTIERVRALRDVPVPGRDDVFLVAAASVDELESDVWFLVESNGREGQIERHVAGKAEGIAAQLQMPRDGLPRRRAEIARRLSPLLAVLLDRNAEAYVRAGRDLGRLVDRLPETTLRADRMGNELGRAKHAALLRFLDLTAAREEAR